MKQYTNVFQKGNFIYHYFIENGTRKREIVRFKPTLGVLSQKDTGLRDIFGNKVGLIKFDSIIEMFVWKKEQGKAVDIFNDIRTEYQFISETYPQEITPEFKNMKVFILDIEVFSKEGFPFPETPKFPITAITIQDMYRNVYYVFGYKDEYTPKSNNIKYYKFKNEREMLESFIAFFRKARPDIITGWNIDLFDIPYIINRIAELFPNEEKENKLSPVNTIEPIEEYDKWSGKRVKKYKIIGVASLDYIRLFKKLNETQMENYTLNYVSSQILGKEKVDYHTDYDSLSDLYEKNYELYLDYNIKDVELVYLLNENKKFLELIMTIAYMTRINFEDSFGSVRPWETLLYNELKQKGIILSPKPSGNHKEDFPGGWVMEPKPGLKEWLVVWDIVSSYPNQIISFNISPETILSENQLPEELKQLRLGLRDIASYDTLLKTSRFKETLKKYNVSMSANGQFFTKEKYGEFPQLVAKIFNTRKEKKAKAKVLWGELQDLKTQNNKLLIEKKKNEHSAMDAQQYTLKILLNSFYGVFSNIWFRYYDLRLAAAVTCLGQICIKGSAAHIEENINDIKVIYQDTDSNFIDLSKIVKNRYKSNIPDIATIRDFLVEFNAKFLAPRTEEFFESLTDNLNAYKNTYQMDFEVICDRTIFTAKKKYIMKLVYKDGYNVDLTKKRPEMKVKGIEIVRTSTPHYIRDKLKELIEIALVTNDNAQCLKYINQLRKEFYTKSFEEIAFPRTVNGLNKYSLGDKSVPIHVRASHTYNKALAELGLTKLEPITRSIKIKFCYIKEPNKFGGNVIACLGKMPPEISNIIEIDYKTQFEKTTMAPIKNIFDVLGWYTEKQASSLAFLSE